MMINKLIKAPFFHFLILGSLLFIVFDVLNPEETQEDNVIKIDKLKIKHISDRFSDKWGRSPKADELKILIEGNILTEAYYREGIKLGLDKNDYTIKKIVRKKVELINKDIISVLDVKDDELQVYLDNHKNEFEDDVTLQKIRKRVLHSYLSKKYRETLLNQRKEILKKYDVIIETEK